MPSGFPEDAEPHPQSVADMERFQYKATWHEAMEIGLFGHKTTGTHEAAQSLVHAKHDDEICANLPGGCGDMPGNIVRL